VDPPSISKVLLASLVSTGSESFFIHHGIIFFLGYLLDIQVYQYLQIRKLIIM
jgi:hypothetical protein